MAILFKIGPKPDQGPLSGPGPVRFGPDPEDFSPVRSVTPGTLANSEREFVCAILMFTFRAPSYDNQICY